MFSFITKLFDTNDKEVKKILPVVEEINSFEEQTRKLKDPDFKKKTEAFKKRLQKGESLDALLPEAYAVIREAARRVLGERPYDVQLIAAIALHRNMVAEQKTGEGKTLSASLPLYLNALTGNGVHLVTVNDYLARVGAGWIGPVFHFLGITTAAIIHDQSFIYDPTYQDKTAIDWRLKFLKPVTRKEAYAADVTYGVNSEFGFDYLRDNMVSDLSQQAQRSHYFAIVDEVDSVLIDEARTPHIMSAPDTEPTDKYYQYAQAVKQLRKDDYEVDEKMHTVHLTEKGLTSVERILNTPNIYEEDFQSLHHVEAALKATTLFHKDKQYIVRDGEVIIVDEFTGRLMQGRRFSEGLHQAIEAKEGVQIKQESKTLATISLQNYFRMYEKLAGMTGTAATEAEEFKRIYNLDVLVIPTHRPVSRTDHADLVYKTMQAKYQAVAKEAAQAHKGGQPVLVGTTSIEQNEIIGKYLTLKGIKHNLLNAKNHEREAQIISEAGEKGAVTVATNMAGRGVDIILGGPQPNQYIVSDNKEYDRLYKEWKKKHDEVVALGGLYVIGTERHESRRIDNQLRGRSGRQGDPGMSRFVISLEDELMRIFGGGRIASLMTRFNLPEDQPLEHGMVSRAIEQAQIKVEGFHFDSRKQTVEYDDVLNKHREIIYGLRKKVLDERTDLKEFVLDRGMEETDYKKKEKELGKDILKQVIRMVSIQMIDQYWMEHLTVLEDLRSGIGLRSYAQRDPLVEYKKEAFGMFERLIQTINDEIVTKVPQMHIRVSDQLEQKTALQKAAEHAQLHEASMESMASMNQKASDSSMTSSPQRPRSVKPVISNLKKVGRNDPCPCGSGLKYKKCGLANAPEHRG